MLEFPNKGAATSLVKESALQAGFDLVRITSAEEFSSDREAALKRINDGLMDGLPWYTPERVRRGTSPETLLPGARSIICLALNYFPQEVTSDEGATGGGRLGKIARYARGKDYHRLMKRRMRKLTLELAEKLGNRFSARWYVDDGPMLDRSAAARAGLGWFGKNSNLLTPELGSWVFLGQIITDLELDPDPPLRKSCGDCVRCMDACPTGAITTPYVIDNSKCISYLTIENRGPIPVELRPKMLDWVFGCDICQEVCPVNRKEQPTGEPAFSRQEMTAVNLVEILGLSEEAFTERFGGTPVKRARRNGLQRNACVALGNLKSIEAVPALGRALRESEPLVRSHAAWALGEIGGAKAVSFLEGATREETDCAVIGEINSALKRASSRG
ncbi:MAG: tRNA epoxyqueuosine(34) reductase QueG [Chloroflexi bacterium]|nr:tRNA epoxyqueuosine(34) reductase QueG [Chloroflexota bacterium]